MCSFGAARARSMRAFSGVSDNCSLCRRLDSRGDRYFSRADACQVRETESIVNQVCLDDAEFRAAGRVVGPGGFRLIRVCFLELAQPRAPLCQEWPQLMIEHCA